MTTSQKHRNKPIIITKIIGFIGDERTIKAITLVALISLISGCATTKNYESILDTWLGSSADDLVASWGPPQNSYTLSDGGKVLEYLKQDSFQIGGFTYSVPVTTHHSGTVSSYTSGISSYDGSSTTYVQKQAPVHTITSKCITRFVVDAKHIINRWTWEGDACKAKKPATVGRIQQGLTMKEVIKIKGRPTLKQTNGKDDVLWYYSRDTENGPYVRFINGEVFTWQD